MELSLWVAVPTPYGEMEVSFGASQNATADAKDRYAVYDQFSTYSSARDWDWFKPWSSHWNELNMGTQWQLGIASPPLGASVGPVAAELRLVVNGSLEGRWRHADPSWLASPYSQQTPFETYTWNRLEASAAADGRIRGTIRVGPWRVSKEWTIIEVGTGTGLDLDGTPGRRTSSMVMDLRKPPPPGSACQGAPVAPPPDAWMAGLPEAPTVTPRWIPPDLPAFAAEVTREVRDRYFLCDGKKRPLDLKRLASLPAANALAKPWPQDPGPKVTAEACARLLRELAPLVDLCTNECSGGVCAIRKAVRVSCSFEQVGGKEPWEFRKK